jgi:HTH-type transcriptional repressor of NAD biosynthesis genes
MMRAFQHALVIGKFYPPHRGHEYLIRSAARSATQVTVVVMAADLESIPLALRVGWLREILASLGNVCVVGVIDNVAVDYHSEQIWQAHVDLMRSGVAEAERCRGTPAGRIDAVFTSEAYGGELARRFDATSVCLDQARTLYPVSGTAVRADPPACWDHLAPCVREHLCRRIVIVGAESTGKSTLAVALAEALRARGSIWTRTQYVPEFGREYTVDKMAIARAAADRMGAAPCSMDELEWTSPEFDLIAVEQQRREDAMARDAGPLLICDTDAWATSIWHERYVGRASMTLARRPATRLGYILTQWQEVPFEQDGLRDGESIRQWMHDRFATQLSEQSVLWIVASGTIEQRVERCLQWIDERLVTAWMFAKPLG